MILNYDSKTGLELLDIFDLIKKKAPEASEAVVDMFSKFETTDKFRDLFNLDDFKSTLDVDDSFKSWVDSLDETQLKTMTAGAALDEYKQKLAQTGKQTSTLGSAVKDLFGNIASFATNALITGGVIFVLTQLGKGVATLIDNYITTADEAKEKIIEEIIEMHNIH